VYDKSRPPSFPSGAVGGAPQSTTAKRPPWQSRASSSSRHASRRPRRRRGGGAGGGGGGAGVGAAEGAGAAAASGGGGSGCGAAAGVAVAPDWRVPRLVALDWLEGAAPMAPRPMTPQHVRCRTTGWGSTGQLTCCLGRYQTACTANTRHCIGSYAVYMLSISGFRGWIGDHAPAGCQVPTMSPGLIQRARTRVFSLIYTYLHQKCVMTAIQGLKTICEPDHYAIFCFLEARAQNARDCLERGL
jgi:hypothetical protein